MTDTPRLPPLPFAEAIAWARARRVVLPAVYYGERPGLVRAAAFTISGLIGLDQIQAVKDSLTTVLETGESFKTWQRRVLSGEIPLQVGPAQIETIFRNNIQQSYNRGRYEQQMGALDSHPWWMYDAVNDSRTRPTHAAMDGYVARHDDPIWTQWTPSCGHRCRCRRIALTADQAAHYQAEDVRRQADPDQAKGRQAALIQGPDPGWGHDPYREPQRGLQQAIAQKEQRGDPALFSAFQSDQRRLTAPIMQIVDMAGFQDVRQALDLVALRRPQWFPGGLQGVHAVSNREFFAAFQQGHFYISTAEIPDLQFAPARELISAMAAIRGGRPLSFQQEYAVEVLQHELVHSAYPLAVADRHQIGGDELEECLVQLVARHRYPDLLRLFGTEPQHAESILLNGYAYDTGTRNLVEIMRTANIDMADIERALRDGPRAQTQQLMADALGTTRKKARWLLNQAMFKPLDDFRAKLVQLQAYAQPPGKG